jgi:hypothetical protein
MRCRLCPSLQNISTCQSSCGFNVTRLTHLHRAATLEGVAATDDECEIVGTKLGIVGGSVRVCEASGC